MGKIDFVISLLQVAANYLRFRDANTTGADDIAAAQIDALVASLIQVRMDPDVPTS